MVKQIPYNLALPISALNLNYYHSMCSKENHLTYHWRNKTESLCERMIWQRMHVLSACYYRYYFYESLYSTGYLWLQLHYMHLKWKLWAMICNSCCHLIQLSLLSFWGVTFIQIFLLVQQTMGHLCHISGFIAYHLQS